MYVFYLHVCIDIGIDVDIDIDCAEKHLQYSHSAEKGIRSPGTGIMHTCETL